MLRLIGQRLIALIPLLFIVSILTFSFTSIMPGDPVDLVLGDDASEEQIQLVRERMGLNVPIVQRYFIWLGKAVQGDFGNSFFYSVKVMDNIKERLPVTISLAAVSAAIALFVGLGAGIAAALRPRSWIDRWATLGATLGQAVPNFWLGLILAAAFAVELRWFPATGFTSLTESPWEWLRSITLPALALGLSSSAAIARQSRSAMVGVLQQDYIRAARAQGLSASRVIFKHALKNALIPVVTVFSFLVTVLLGGALIVEQVFAINGLGSLAINAVWRQDIPVIQGIVLVSVVIVVGIQLLTDIAYGYLNPKARPV
ncbi:ABC transporter permease [bacterium]|nr:ABC transporter permease [bacterium]